jgi:large subunit ribosomal protein L37Ae
MGRTKKVGPAGGLKARYGATVRKRYIKVLKETKKQHRCPQCKGLTVSRQSIGVWKCRKCEFTFTGGAYQPSTKLGEIAKRATKGVSTELQKPVM